jgi:hypothetical protein
MASATKNFLSDEANKERACVEVSRDDGALSLPVGGKVDVSSASATNNQGGVSSKQTPHRVEESDYKPGTSKGSIAKDFNSHDTETLVHSGSVTLNTDRLDSPVIVDSKELSGQFKSPIVSTNSSEAADATGGSSRTESVSFQTKPREDNHGPLLTKEQFDDLVRRCTFIAIYGIAKVPKVRYKRLEESVLTICRLFYTRRHKVDWFIEELNRSEGRDWTVSQWVGFLHGSNFKMVKLKAYKGIGNFCYYNGSVFTTAGILGSCKCLREVRTGFGGKQGNRDVLPEEELKMLYESEEIVKVDPNAFPDDSEIAPLKPVRPRMTLKRQSDNIAQTYGLEHSSLRNPKISYSLTMGEAFGDSHSKTGSSPVETDSEVEVAELEASPKENDMESTESSESDTKTSLDASPSASRKRVRENSSSQGGAQVFDNDSIRDSDVQRNKKLRASIPKDAKESSDEYLDAVMNKFAAQIQEKLDLAIQNLENKIELITQRVSKLEQRMP